MLPESLYYAAANEINESDAILILAGAGMGVDSGLPDFRGVEGFWKAYPPMEKLGISFYEMANPLWFKKNPRLAWGFYGHRMNLYRKTQPHEGFSKLLELTKIKRENYFVFTSNVDGQFQKAGFSENKIYECHGSINHAQCSALCSNEIWSSDEINLKIDTNTFYAEDPLPVCKNCEKPARPNILMFNDWSWVSSRSDLQQKQYTSWLRNISTYKTKLAVIELGAGKSVATVRIESESVARRFHSKLIRINPSDYDVPDGNISFPFGAKEGINKIYTFTTLKRNIDKNN